METSERLRKRLHILTTKQGTLTEGEQQYIEYIKAKLGENDGEAA